MWNLISKWIKSFLFTIGCVFFIIKFRFDVYPTLVTVLKSINNEDRFKVTIAVSFTVFIALMVISGIIALAAKALYNLCLPIYYSVFYDEMHEKIGITLDENKYVKSCFVKLKNGKVIPVEISIISIPAPESKEENKSEEKKNE